MSASKKLPAFIAQRRSVRAFTKRMPSKEKIDIILEAGRWAPSCMNKQPWTFIVVRKPSTVRSLLNMCFYNHSEHAPPVIIAVAIDFSLWSGKDIQDKVKQKFLSHIDYADAGMPVLNMQYAAESLGIGSCIKSPISKGADKLLGLPQTHSVVLLLGCGYADRRYDIPHQERKPLASIVCHERYKK